MVTDVSILISKEMLTEMIGEIKLAHFTVKEYLIAVQAKFSEGDASCLIAESCLGYLLQFTARGTLNHKNINNFQPAYYAAKHWVDHARDAERGDRESAVMRTLMEDLFEPNGAPFVTWIQLWNPGSPGRQMLSHYIMHHCLVCSIKFKD
ncbi:hypothetical protein L208DRAFT_187590 [Tricholoma matsutake]|nr:hypothetical protein L208DRAFT_187590 [Tricholoma matsutake 945]